MGVRSRVTGFFCFAWVVWAAAGAFGQDSKAPSFEVASIKTNLNGGTRIRFETPPGRLAAANAPLRFLIRQAYRVPEARILGGPGWLDTLRFDILANTSASVAPSPDGVRAMLRTLLAERFGLTMRQENREMPVYVLRMARADGKLGPNLHASTTDCAGQAARMSGGRVACGVLVSQAASGASLRGGATTMSEFARYLGDFLDRPLLEETGLSGSFDLELQFAAVRSALPGESVPGGLGAGNLDEIPTVFTAIQEQLGLKLDAQRRTTDVFVIDSVSRPSEN